MKYLNRSLLVLVMSTLLTGWSAPCSAADPVFKDIFENAMYGGLVGALVGGALMTFTHKPTDHLNYISTGAAVGVLGGVVYGATKSSRSLVSIENGSVKLAMPTILPELQTVNSKGATTVMLKTELVRGVF